MASSFSYLPIWPGPFRFFDLPAELRLKILTTVLSLHRVIDLDPLNNFDGVQRLAIFLASRRFHSEASHVFYSGHTFRVFPTHWRFFGNKVPPLLSRLPLRYRRELITLELKFGPGWSDPPKSWRVSERLGLEDMAGVRKVKVFVECDPSNEIFIGFRPSRDSFTNFASSVFEEMVKRLPTLEEVEFDGFPSVKHDGPLVTRLIDEAKRSGKLITWGPQISSRSCWGAADDHKDSVLREYGWSTNEGDFHVCFG